MTAGTFLRRYGRAGAGAAGAETTVAAYEETRALDTLAAAGAVSPAPPPAAPPPSAPLPPVRRDHTSHSTSATFTYDGGTCRRCTRPRSRTTVCALC